MKLKELILKNRSYRRFDESRQIDAETIESLIDLARLSASGANKQPLKYLYFNTTKDYHLNIAFVNSYLSNSF